MLSTIALHSSSNTNSLAPSECMKPSNELPWQASLALLKWLNALAFTKLHWHPLLEVTSACNLLPLICLVCPIGSGCLVRFLGQLVSEPVPRNHDCACILALIPSLVDFLLPRNVCHVKGSRGWDLQPRLQFFLKISNLVKYNRTCAPLVSWKDFMYSLLNSVTL